MNKTDDFSLSKRLLSKRLRFEIVFYISIAVTVCIFMKLLFNLPVRNFFVVYQTPLVYWGDTYGVLRQTQNIISGGSMFYYPNASAPFGWSSSETIFGFFNYLLIFLGTRLSNKAGLIVNMIYLLSYPTVALTAAFTLRKLNINRAISFMGALLYAFLPYHYMRSTPHIWLSLYYMVPLVCLVCVWILKMEILNEKDKVFTDNVCWFTRLISKLRNAVSRLISKKMLFAMLVCLLLSIGESYTAFFGAICILLVSIYSSVRGKSLYTLISGVFLEIIIGIGFGIQLLPVILKKHAVVSGFLVRSISDTEWVGLKIMQLVLPVDGHRISLFAKIKDIYNTNTIVLGENTMETLGIVMSIGFVLSIVFMLFFSHKEEFRVISDLGFVNICLILICTIGGFNVFITMFISTVMRCYDRICIYIAFFSLIAIAIFLQFLYDKIKEKVSAKRQKYLVLTFTMIITVVTVFGLYDQVPAWAALRYTDDVPNKKYLRLDWEILNNKFPMDEWKSDEDFVNQIGIAVPENSMIFQLPSIGGARIMKLNSELNVWALDICKPFFHSTTLKWSSGFEADTESDKWNMYQEKLPVNEMIDNLVYVGFSGIYIDTYAYSDEVVANLLQNIAGIAKTEPIISENGRLYFFSIVDYGNKLKSGLSDEELVQRKVAVLNYFDAYKYPNNYFPTVVNDSCNVSGKLKILNTLNGYYNSDGYLTSDPEKVGSSPHLLFGPYRTLTKGTYKVVFDIDTSDTSIPDGEVGMVVATAANGTETFTSKSFSKNESEIAIEFAVPIDSENCEIHIITSQANVVFKGYTITKVS